VPKTENSAINNSLNPNNKVRRVVKRKVKVHDHKNPQEDD
jgi:hypothetical protein